MGLEDIQVAVQVYVTYANPHAGLLHSVLAQGSAAGQADFGKRSVFIVSEQQTGSRIARHIDVRPTSVVKIGRDCRHAIASRRLTDSSGIADVLERPVAVVAIQIAAPQRQA